MHSVARAAALFVSFILAFPAFAIDAPLAVAATDVTTTGFTANWQPVTGATGYRLDVMAVTGTTPTRTVEAFDGLVSGDATTLPDGWSASAGFEANSTSGYYGGAAPSLKFSADGMAATTCAYPASITNLSFYVRVTSTKSTFSIEGQDAGGTWTTLVDHYATGGTGNYTPSFDIDAGQGIRRIRLTFHRGGGAINIDDLAVAYDVESYSPVLADADAGAATAYEVTALAPATYRYVVRATDGTDTSSDSNPVYAVVTGQAPAPDAPVAFEATDVSASGFTANWSAAGGATGYLLDVSRMFQSPVVRLTEGFDTFTGSAETLPEGWSISGTPACYTSDLNSGASPNSVKLATGGQSMTSCDYAGSITNVTFWMRGNSAGSNSTVTLEGLPLGGDAAVDTDWILLHTEPVTGSGKTADADVARAQDIRRLRLTFQREKGAVAIDDVSAAYGGTYCESIGAPLPTSGNTATNAVVTGLAEGSYEYTVRATSNVATSEVSNAIAVVVGTPPHAPPVILPFADGLSVRLGGSIDVPVVLFQEDGDPITGTNVATTVSADRWALADGVFTFTPAEADLGAQTFSFTAVSEGGTSDAAVLTIAVKRPVVPAIPLSACAMHRYEQDFDALAGANGEWDNQASPLPAWQAAIGGSAISSYTPSRGNSTSSGFYSFGADDSADRALGTLAGNGKTLRFGVAFTNDTSFRVCRLSVSFTGAQYRVGSQNNSTNTLAFAWRTTGDASDLSLSAGTWNDVPALAYNTSATADSHGVGAVEGVEAPLSQTLDISLPAGEILLLRWMDVDDTGSDHAMAIDDLVVSWNFGGGTLILLR
ncbi:MAG: Ig-like domain-containing protein [Kiritimatiellia bacterium]|jgi:hypothetical protein